MKTYKRRAILLASAATFMLSTAVILAGQGSASSPPVVAMPTAGLVGFWPLDGNALDASGNGNNGTIHGATPISGVTGGAYDFDGNDRIDLPNFSFPNSTYTVSIWEKSTSEAVSSFRSMFDQLNEAKGGPFELFIGTDSFLKDTGPSFIIWNVGEGVVNLEQPRLNVHDGHWHMITGTYKTGRQRLYVDGALMRDGAFRGPLPTNTTGAAIGGHTFYSYHHPWVGSLDDAAIYNRVLSPVEVLHLYQSANPPPA